MDRLIGFDPQLLHDAVLTGINVFILFFALSYLLFNPVRDVLEKRRKKIADELEQAAADQTKAASLKEEYEAKLKDVNKEAESILEAARKKRKTVKQRWWRKPRQKQPESLSGPAVRLSWRKERQWTT